MSIKSVGAVYRSDGRVGRTKYWVVNIASMLLLGLVSPAPYSDPGLLFWLLLIPLTVYCIHITIQRAHDRNRSFLFIFLFAVPIVWFWPFIELGFIPRVDKDNAYGTRA